MAKRKRKPGSRKGFKLRPVKDYRSSDFTYYTMNAEIGILQASKIEPDLKDSNVSESLKDLITRLEEPEALPKLLPAETSADVDEVVRSDSQRELNIVQALILSNLRRAFDKHGPLEAEDVAGILDVIKTSVKRWSVDRRGRGYLTYIEEFLGQMGIDVQEISKEQARALGLDVGDS